jgi:hypothetical protein
MTHDSAPDPWDDPIPSSLGAERYVRARIEDDVPVWALGDPERDPLERAFRAASYDRSNGGA